MKKIAAFTITELMVVSLLGSVCAAAAFTGLEIIQTQYFSYEKETSRVLEVGELQRQLQSDVLAASTIYREEIGVGFSFADYEVHYVFDEQGLHRIVDLAGVRKKTFSLKVMEIKSHYQGQMVAQGKLDYLTLHLECEETLFSLSFEKNYSASEQMRPQN